MDQVHLSDVQIANLTLLLTIRDAVHQDQIAACIRFALDRAQAERLRTMTVQHVLAIVANVGDTSLFPPRRNLLALMDSPLPLAGPLAAVQVLDSLAA